MLFALRRPARARPKRTRRLRSTCEEEAEILVQVNGKLRGRITAPFGSPREELERRALADAKAKPYVDGKQVAKVVIVPDKLVNIVVKG